MSLCHTLPLPPLPFPSTSSLFLSFHLLLPSLSTSSHPTLTYSHIFRLPLLPLSSFTSSILPLVSIIYGLPQEEDSLYKQGLIPVTSGTTTDSNMGSKTDEFAPGLVTTAASAVVKQEPTYNSECTSYSDSLFASPRLRGLRL